ncbi:similar to Saccharomyces cerevisiae YKL034W TUL1 Golgi-localized RING-finger ubiquitin ligase (E3) [Maudiozyma barnettii]|uniref:RING-type E3 ubiquitin transferase n=1 Tax=Maudiozyma barnettii TaxID=61262 RepID=A0A8H2ZJY1_9SACH|nr:ubiquitin-protein ligase TUL1 [Kazachstania barnettii]CAB4256413.1 similar to Saccharomyces cerevisiae YKL034W TUL1 Golgi-localized RING-finger ubiquitin ligase (E3) [Kazachstania barnettii]CAD1785022.1 similar to Saccharomyces cerevisiae YKL034W TUL1 Golgi-localized RING-finger ubiquitin ligase (E3) [Kazachstania barnettii]
MELDGNTLIFIILILFLFFSSPGGNGVTSQYEFNQLHLFTQQLETEYSTFQNLTYNSNFKNITGLKLSYHDVAENALINATYPIDSKNYEQWYNNENYLIMPDEITQIIGDSIWNITGNGEENIFPPIITSTLLGTITLNSNDKYSRLRMPFANFYEPPRDFSDNIPPVGDTYMDDWEDYNEIHNVTFAKGEMKVQFTHVDKVFTSLQGKKKKYFNSQDENWKLLNVKVDFTDKNENEKHSINTLGVYDIKTGRILAMSESAKFHSLFALPHYMGIGMTKAGQKQTFEQSKKLINEYWNTSKYIDTLTMGYINTLYDDAIEKCEFMMFFQLKPWNQYNKDQLKIIDDELKWPLGRPANLTHVPDIVVTSGMVYSPDCGISLSTNDIHGERYELKIRSIRIHMLCGIFLFAAQIYLLLRQMQHTNTPSSVNKISFYTFCMINLVDGCLATLYFISATLVPELYLPLVISAFASFILASIFETRYLISVYASQVNERNVGIITLLRGRTEDPDAANERPVVIPDEASISSSLYGRFAFTLITFTFLILNSMSWPRHFRIIFEYSAIFILNSYWWPQVFRNAIKGIPSRRERERIENLANRRQNKVPLLWKFIIGTTFIRTLPIIYFFTYSSNIFRHHKDTRFVVILSLWLLFQIVVLYSQDILGARWFLSQHTIPEGYSYFKPVSLALLKEHGDIDDMADTANKGSSGDHPHNIIAKVDCAICMSEVPVYVEELPETHGVDIHDYMVTPCNHIFHTLCLENWMSYKLQCPVCRAPLPPC